MSGVKSGNVIKRSVSFSETVNAWAEELAKARGFENNFSGFCADLVRRARDSESANSAQTMAESAVADAFDKSGAVPAPAPVSYRSQHKAARRSKAKPATGLSKKDHSCE